ncbi:hypothetical protein K1719_024244 [Acacia pycnantha]|nr:hypothetical protein K1719_024244 [Acacia pycnantha]
MDMTHDIVPEIFSWLPAKLVYKFKCVNKFCKNISSPGETYFIQKQSQNALLRDDSCFFLQPNWIQKETQFHHLSSNNTTSGASHCFFHGNIRRVKAMGVKEDPIIVTGFIVVNGDQLIFATDMKIYGYGLWQENFMKLEEICELEFGLNATIFTPYSDTLHPCGHTAVTLPLMQQ